jgi:hypothetical protein
MQSDILEKAWSCVIPLFLGKCMTESENNGPGISVFKLKDNLGNYHRNFNCDFNYIIEDSPFWVEIIEKAINYTEIKNFYDFTKNILVGIQLPVYEDGVLTDAFIVHLKIYKYL